VPELAEMVGSEVCALVLEASKAQTQTPTSGHADGDTKAVQMVLKALMTACCNAADEVVAPLMDRLVMRLLDPEMQADTEKDEDLKFVYDVVLQVSSVCLKALGTMLSCKYSYSYICYIFVFLSPSLLYYFYHFRL